MVGVSCRACGDGQPGPPALGDGESCPGGGRSVLQGLWGRRTGHTGLGGWGVLPRGWSEFPAGPAGMDNRAHRPGGMGSPAQGVVGVSCRDCGEVDPGTPAWGDGESCPGVGRSVLLGLWGGRCTASLPWGSWQCNSCNALPHCLGAVDSATPAMHCLTAWGQRTVQLLQCTASLPGGSGQWNSCNAPPHCLGAVGSGTPAMPCLTAWGQWAAQLLQCTASLPWGSGQWNSRNALPHCPGGVGSATPAMHCLTAWGQWAVQLLQCTASPPGNSGQCNSCNALPHCLGAVGSGPPSMHDVVWCGVVWCGVPKALLPKGKRPGCLPTGKGKRAGLCVLCARCV